MIKVRVHCYELTLGLIQRLMEISNQLENRNTVFALDALRNLFVQANIMDLPQLGSLILDC